MNSYVLSFQEIDSCLLYTSISKALEYLKRSANQGNQFAQYRLGKLYLMDEDVKKDIPTALQFLIAAAEQNNQYAQYTLGKLYLMGKDVPRDKDSAVRWLTLSAAQGNMYAQDVYKRQAQCVPKRHCGIPCLQRRNARRKD